jgi:hypothetical protein
VTTQTPHIRIVRKAPKEKYKVATGHMDEVWISFPELPKAEFKLTSLKQVDIVGPVIEIGQPPEQVVITMYATTEVQWEDA